MTFELRRDLKLDDRCVIRRIAENLSRAATMKRLTNFGSRSRAKRARKQNARKARRLAVAVAVIALVTVVVKEIVADSVKNLRESIATAETQFSNSSDQSNISLEIFNLQQQAEALTAKSVASAPAAKKDFGPLILQARAEMAQVKAGLNADFDSASKLIEKLPPGATALRDQLPQVKTIIDESDSTAQTILKADTANDAGQYADIKLAMIMYLTAELPVILVGDEALTYAKRIEASADTVLRLCNRIFYFLVALGACLAVYAAVLNARAQSD